MILARSELRMKYRNALGCNLHPHRLILRYDGEARFLKHTMSLDIPFNMMPIYRIIWNAEKV
jgi:hypothetical protein